MNFVKFFKGNNRSNLVKKNIIASVLIKGIDTLVYLLLVPLTLGYLNAYEYGIWLTLSSLLVWINSFDIGLGNGLRNKLTIAIAEDDKEKGRGYVSTTFFMLVLIVVCFFSVFSIVINYIDWYTLLNVQEAVVPNLKRIVFLSFFFFCINFIFRFIGNVYQALQLPAVNNLIGLGGHLVSIFVIYMLTQLTSGSLLWVAIAYSAAFPLLYTIIYPVTFWKLFPYLAPSWKYFRKEYLKDLFSLGALFFLLQIMAIVLFSLSNVLISRLFGPEQVTPYNIAYKYFSVVPIFFHLLLAPLWSAATDAYAKNDTEWIRKSLRKVSKTLALIGAVVLLMILLSDFAYRLWVGDTVRVPLSMSVLMGVYVLTIQYSLGYSYYLNGMGKLRLQTINICVVAILFLPLCYFLSKPFGVNGILMGMIITNLSGAILNFVQLNRLLNNTATGIWAR